ncbi:MAG: hypothetical protein HOP15_16435 [Planctomycetes bacterium]|nr:hypothetical protein [Planctomycetota bacterium]
MPTSSNERRGDPNVAVLLTWFLPGAGHLYVGRTALGLLVLVLIEGLYALGWFLADGRTFEYLDPELRGPFATLLTPEAGNLGALLLHLKSSGFGASEPMPFPGAMLLGGYLTSLSGVLNLFVAAHVHLCARTVRAPSPSARNPALLLACAWLVPGLGHWLQGRRLRGTLVFVLLAGLFVVGTGLAAGTNLSRERHFYYWSGQFLLGAPSVLFEFFAGHPRVTGELRWVDVGLLYACMAGLLNVLAMLDVCGVAEKRWFEAAPSAAEPAKEPASSEVPA